MDEFDEFDEVDDGTLLNLKDKSNDELRGLLDELSAEERHISYRRRVLHGRIDILRAELVRRLAADHQHGNDVISGGDLNKLIEILANDLTAPRREVPEPDEEEDL